MVKNRQIRLLERAQSSSPFNSFRILHGRLEKSDDGLLVRSQRRVLYPTMLRMRTLPAGFIEPCLPTKADTLPSGGLWIHEIKHDGFRIIARKNGAQVRLYSRPKSCGSAWAVATVRTTLTATNAVLSLIS
jgi:ATP-dependent DNA ligase